jgi:hypothetical protein
VADYKGKSTSSAQGIPACDINRMGAISGFDILLDISYRTWAPFVSQVFQLV